MWCNLAGLTASACMKEMLSSPNIKYNAMQTYPNRQLDNDMKSMQSYSNHPVKDTLFKSCRRKDEQQFTKSANKIID